MSEGSELNLVRRIDETPPTYFGITSQWTVAKKGFKEVHVWSSGSEKKRMTVALTCTRDGKMLPVLAIFLKKEEIEV